MKRAKLKIEILTVIFCSLIFAFSEKNNSIYADEVLTDMELPTGRLLFEEETEEAADEDYESIEESDIAEQSLLRTADIAADDWNKYGSDYFYDQLSDEEKACSRQRRPLRPQHRVRRTARAQRDSPRSGTAFFQFGSRKNSRSPDADPP